MLIPWRATKNSSASGGANFLPLIDADAVRALFATPSDEPQLLFIHDPTCGISDRAYEEMSGLDGNVHLILTGDGQHLSRLVEALSGVRHESPQTIVVHHGKVRWSASHHHVRRDSVRNALASLWSATHNAAGRGHAPHS